MKTICSLRGRRVSFLAHQPSWYTVLNILQIPSDVQDPYILMENSYNTSNTNFYSQTSLKMLVSFSHRYYSEDIQHYIKWPSYEVKHYFWLRRKDGLTFIFLRNVKSQNLATGSFVIMKTKRLHFQQKMELVRKVSPWELKLLQD